MASPYSFDEFFSSNQEEAISPFLAPSSRKWGRNLSLRGAFFSGFLLAFSFFFFFYSTPLSFLFLTGVYFFSGTPALINAIHDLANFEINIDVLMTLAALLSVAIQSEFEGALLLVLFELSGALEIMVTKKARSSVLNLYKLSPQMGSVLGEGGVVYQKAVKEIRVGDRILIRAGEVVPLDGEVIEGRSSVNLTHLTGETAPIVKAPGDDVPAGAGNLEGSLVLRITRISSDSTLSRIIKLIMEAQEVKPRIQRFLNTFGKYYAIIVILLVCFFVFLLPLIWGLPYLGYEGSIYRSLAFLIAASPCALIIATPTAYLSAISSCAKRGVILKGGVFLDAAARCKTIALDKTGTVTTGALRCTEIKPICGAKLEEKVVISIAASLEKHAVHPIAKAIVELAELKRVETLPVENFCSIPGYGLEGTVAARPARIGHLKFIQKKVDVFPIESDRITTYLEVEGSVVGFYFEDRLRPNVLALLDQLREDKFRIIMLSGDRRVNVDLVAKQLGIEEIFADLLPEDKLLKVAKLVDEGPLMMVGDGINDAPALTRATVGISMGKIGSATAVGVSDVIFINDDIALLGWFLKKARQTRRILKQNVSLALAVILLATFPAIMGFLPLWLAVILHEGGTVLVGLNSLRLLKK